MDLFKDEVDHCFGDIIPKECDIRFQNATTVLTGWNLKERHH